MMNTHILMDDFWLKFITIHFPSNIRSSSVMTGIYVIPLTIITPEFAYMPFAPKNFCPVYPDVLRVVCEPAVIVEVFNPHRYSLNNSSPRCSSPFLPFRDSKNSEKLIPLMREGQDEGAISARQLTDSSQ